jgi:hypothetical protein
VTIPTTADELRRDFEIIGKRYLDALGDRRRTFCAYGNKPSFHILAVDDAGGFIVADEIPDAGWAQLIADTLNLMAACAGCLGDDERAAANRANYENPKQ